MTHHKLSRQKLAYFPNLAQRHRITSDECDDYNCVAWAAGEFTRRWDPTPGYYWPSGVLRDPANVQSFADAFATLGYAPCADGTLEQGFEKIAIYTHTGEPMHVSRQLADGRWTSKLGYWEDIEHQSEHDVEGTGIDCYGTIDRFMRRPRAT